VNSAWADSRLELSDRPFLHSISSSSRRKIRQFTPSRLSGTAWAGASLCWKDEPLRTAIASSSRPTLCVQQGTLLAMPASDMLFSECPYRDVFDSSDLCGDRDLHPDGANCSKSVHEQVSPDHDPTSTLMKVLTSKYFDEQVLPGQSRGLPLRRQPPNRQAKAQSQLSAAAPAFFPLNASAPSFVPGAQVWGTLDATCSLSASKPDVL